MRFITMDEDGYWGVTPDRPWGHALRDAGANSGLKNSMYVLGDPDDLDAPLAVMVNYPPNWEFPRHSHGSPRMEVIVTGSIIIDDRVLGPGTVMTADRDEFYGPHMVGPQGCVTVEVMNGRGGRLLTFETPDGPQTVNFDDPESFVGLPK